MAVIVLLRVLTGRQAASADGKIVEMQSHEIPHTAPDLPRSVRVFAIWRWRRRTRWAVGVTVALLLYVSLDAPALCILKTSTILGPFDPFAARVHVVIYAPMRAVYARSPALREWYKAEFIAACRLTGDRNSYAEFDAHGWHVNYTEYNQF
jgi:hypothetical protein